MFKRFLLGMSLLVCSGSVFAALDPISWSVSPSAFPSTVTVGGGTYVLTYTFKNNLPALQNPIQILKTATPLGEFSFVDNCSGKKLAYNEMCTVSVDLTPVTSGTKTVQLTIAGYSNDQVPLPAQSTNASGSGVAITGAVTTALTPGMIVGTANPYGFSFTNDGATAADAVAVSCVPSGCAVVCGTSPAVPLPVLGGYNLAPGASCLVTGSYTPTSATPSTQGVTATFSYNSGASVTKTTSNTVNAQTGLVGVASPSTASTANILQNQTVTVTYTFTNYGPNPIAAGSTITPPSTALGETWTPSSTTSTCLSAIPVGQSCTYVGTFTDSNPTGSAAVLKVTLTPPGSSPPAPEASTTLTVTGSTADGRTIHFVNQCSFPVWFSLSSGAYTATPGGPTVPCSSGCPTGSTCNASAGLCYWNTYLPTANSSGDKSSLELTPGGGTATLIIPNTPASTPSIFWSGGLAGRTGCTGAGCVTGDCGVGTGSCQSGQGFSAPVTQAEFTLLPSSVDTYDVEVIDGFNIPVEMAPDSPTTTPDGYSCGTVGNPTAANGFSACNWSAGPSGAPVPATLDPSNYYWVTSGGSSCKTQSDCSGSPGTICGIAQVPVNPGVAPPKLAKQCGKFLGYMTPKQACAYDIPNSYANANALGFACNTISADGGQMVNLYGCTGTNSASCYTNGTPCCGCVNWQTPPALPAGSLPSSTTACQSHDLPWMNQVPQYITWMKSACSNVYTYPYDDKSSTFQCQKGTPNTQSYTVTFCAGNSGIPAAYSADDGRNG